LGSIGRILAGVRRALVVTSLGLAIGAAIIVAPTLAGARSQHYRSSLVGPVRAQLLGRLHRLVRSMPAKSPQRPTVAAPPLLPGVCYVGATACSLTPCRYYVAPERSQRVAAEAAETVNQLPLRPRALAMRPNAPGASPSGCPSPAARPPGALRVVDR
jgi:hypothetical protein